jgi:hypothetical protein
VIGLSPIGSRIGDPNKIPHPSQHPNVSFSTIDEGAPSFLHSINEAAAPSLFQNMNETPQMQNTSFSTIEESAPSFLHNADEASPSLFHNFNEAPQMQDTSFSMIEEGAASFIHNADEPASPSLFHSSNETPQTRETAESSKDLSAGRVSAVEYNRTHDSEISTLNSSSAGRKKGVGGSSSIHFSPGSPLDPRDRRHYRTVVPSRVFMNATDDIPEQYDSFLSAPTPRTQPLLDSFDAAFHRSGYSDPT